MNTIESLNLLKELIPNTLEDYLATSSRIGKSTLSKHLGISTYKFNKLYPEITSDILAKGQWQAKAYKVHGNKYDYTKVVYKGSQHNVCITCPEHGDFWQRPANHVNLKNGCPKCADRNNGELKRTPEEKVAEFLNKKNLKYLGRYVLNDRLVIKFSCPKHGISTSYQSNVMKGHGCTECGKDSTLEKRFSDFTVEHFIQRSKTIWGEDTYDYSRFKIYTNANATATLKCNKHDHWFEQRIANHLNHKAQGCVHCSKSGTSKAEKELLDIFAEYNPMHRYNCKGVELDLYFPEQKVAVEFNGTYWHSEQQGKHRNYHLNKTLHCINEGIHLIHVWEYDWLSHKKSIVISQILNALGATSRRVYARKCEVRGIDTDTARNFLESYHIQGYCASSVKLGLYLDKELLMVATFSKARFSNKAEWELIRLSTLHNTSVIGGAGKLLKHFERSVLPKSILSYCHRFYGQGTVYKKLGFSLSHSTEPGYMYIINGGPKSRNGYQKSLLKNKLEIFDTNKTEYQNMLDNGYDRIWDCGNLVFIKEYN